ncbi:TlpA family protein disulfide reductase [Campylobacter troglodytis]|uniref:TlpA family protein disulfide reductase n=1 Tax=Campylobacter troglodytis TaxID=654363 RepID=UPI00115842FB|nr:TlpA disulfide reductase family protein [Campylobacter troglodytis]TQR61096.1 TlpA family protein disulfide reductase [Campylobacter troglodytis]
MILRVFLLFLLLYFFAACEGKKSEDDLNATRSSELKQDEKLNFSLILNSGKEIFIKSERQRLEFDTEDRAVLFVFFTTWCKPCNAMIPHLNKLQEKYKESFVIVGVLLEEKEANELNDFLNSNKISYPIAQGDGNYLLAKSIGGINALPVMVLYSNEGKLINHYLGIIPQEMLDIDIQKAFM